jgi:tRNA (cytidine/uridine-2'-O-)-methyltransferase
LIGRLGFRLNDRALRRAGVDYWNRVDLIRHDDWASFAAALEESRVFAFSAHGLKPYTRVEYRDGDCLLFGSETKGLPASILQRNPQQSLLIPMPGGGVRSLNLATAVGIAVYEALRQIHGWSNP